MKKNLRGSVRRSGKLDTDSSRLPRAGQARTGYLHSVPTPGNTLGAPGPGIRPPDPGVALVFCLVTCLVSETRGDHQDTAPLPRSKPHLLSPASLLSRETGCPLSDGAASEAEGC
jgi:hypothetical protein